MDPVSERDCPPWDGPSTYHSQWEMLLSASVALAEKVWLSPVVSDTGDDGDTLETVGAWFAGAGSITITVAAAEQLFRVLDSPGELKR